ncbi:MAG: phage integrase SAM-like domain-containing protein, partial [Muribaculaceae bacterium]|nr:phage integrase SAM-like domain-containing protein [Muribaculaceae bacterium]
MASLKIKFKSSSIHGHEGTIFYQILHDRRQRQLFSDYHVYPSEWDEDRSMVRIDNRSERMPFILSIRERIRWDVERLYKIIRKFDNTGMTYTVDDIIEEFSRHINEYSLFNFMERMIIRMKQNGKIRTSETYSSTLNSFKRFRNNEDIMLDSLTSEIMEDYEAWHRQRGVAANTISFYTRILRAVYNRAVEEGVIENRNPFRHVYT